MRYVYISKIERYSLAWRGRGQNFQDSIWKHAMPNYEWNRADSGDSTDILIHNKVSCDMSCDHNSFPYLA